MLVNSVAWFTQDPVITVTVTASTSRIPPAWKRLRGKQEETVVMDSPALLVRALTLSVAYFGAKNTTTLARYGARVPVELVSVIMGLFIPHTHRYSHR